MHEVSNEKREQIGMLMRDLEHDLFIADGDDIVGYLAEMLEIASGESTND